MKKSLTGQSTEELKYGMRDLGFRRQRQARITKHLQKYQTTSVCPVVDSGFSSGGEPISKGDANPVYLPNFSRKLYENEQK